VAQHATSLNFVPVDCMYKNNVQIIAAYFFQQEDSGKPYVYLSTSRLYYLLFSLVSFKLMTHLTQLTQYRQYLLKFLLYSGYKVPSSIPMW
jgi:hypothetical protein